MDAETLVRFRAARERFAKHPVRLPLNMAEDRSGNSTGARCDAACRWCASGACSAEGLISSGFFGGRFWDEVVDPFTNGDIKHAEALRRWDALLAEAGAVVPKAKRPTAPRGRRKARGK